MKASKKRGFTIIELVIVIAVIAILAAVLIPTFSDLIKKAKISSDTQIVRNMNTALAMSEADQGKSVDAYKAYEVLKSAGFLAERLNPTTEGYYYAFDALNNRMLILNENFDVYYPEEYKSQTMENDGNAWSIYVSDDAKETELRAAFEKTGKAELKATIVIPGTKLPSGVTEDSFIGSDEAAASGKDVVQAISTIGGSKANHKDMKSAMDAINNSTSGGTVYLPTNGSAVIGEHQDLTNDLVIYANGTDFAGKDISIEKYAAAGGKELNLTIYDAKNIHVWGKIEEYKTGIVYNIKLVNCTMDGVTNEGLVFLTGSKNTVNLTLENCYVKGDGLKTNGVYMNAGGTIKLYNCTFENCAVGVAISNDMTEGTLAVNVENCYFVSCGTTTNDNTNMVDYAAPLRFVKKEVGGTVTALFKNNTFTDTLGVNGDVLVGEYRASNASNPITAKIISSKTAIKVCKVEDGSISEKGTTTVVDIAAGSNEVSVTCGTRN